MTITKFLVGLTIGVGICLAGKTIADYWPGHDFLVGWIAATVSMGILCRNYRPKEKA